MSNVRVITTFQFVCPVTSNGVVSSTTLSLGATAIPRAIVQSSSSTSTSPQAASTPIPANVGDGRSTASASLTTPIPGGNFPTVIPPTATPMTTTVVSTLPNGDLTSVVAATTVPPNTRTFAIVPLTTTLTINVFPSPRPTDLNAYLPPYAVIPDGSLITPLYHESSVHEHMRIFITGALFMLFVRNILVAIDYLRRTKSRDRTLFWLLLFSQMWGPVRFIPITAGFFSSATDCRAIQIISFIALEISYSVLVTFILGMKAYRCLKRSKIVLGVIGTLQVAAYVTFLVGLGRMRAGRGLSGDCVSRRRDIFTALSVLLQFIESGFVFCCFLYAVVKTSRRTATQGRLSIALSSAVGIAPAAPTAPQHTGEAAMTPGLGEKRGWWDYVPDNHDGIGTGRPGLTLPKGTAQTEKPAAEDPFMHPVERWRERIVSTIWKRGEGPTGVSRPASPALVVPRKSSIHSDEPIPHPDRDKFGSLSAGQRAEGEEVAAQMPELALVDSRTGLANGVESFRSSTRSRGRSPKLSSKSSDNQRGKMRMPKMMLLRAVMKDELFYTAMITLSCVVSTIGLVIGAANRRVLFSGGVWLEINWGVVSVLVIRSFAQVIARQERDAVLQDPTAWNVAIKTEDGFGRSPALRRGAMDYGFAQGRGQRGAPSVTSRRTDISSHAFYRSRPPTMATSVSDYGSAIERARRADESRPPIQPLPETDPDDPFSEFERIVDLPRSRPRSRELGSPIPSTIAGIRRSQVQGDDDDEPGPSDSVSQAPGRRRGPPPPIPRRAPTDYSTDIGTMSIMGIVPARSIDRSPPSPHGSRDSSAYEPSFIEGMPETPMGPHMTHS
ncbi:hypothetical protein FS749_010218 [Ceratobasidium sp. UAMH 11750]|nr:hypothetical protein FS749_010218 [Ceratobasidium sp. UAMH 11750]